MDEERGAGRITKIVLIVVLEYVVLIGLFLAAITFGQPTVAQVASFAAVLFGLLTFLNFWFARNVLRPPFENTASSHLRLLREEFLYLRFYFDEILETMSSGILVLDRLMNVRAMNHAERHLLTLKEKEELVGKPFRFHPLSKEIYTGEIYAHRGKPLLSILESCASEGSSILLQDVHFASGNGHAPIPLDILVYPWKNRHDETERIVLRMDDKSIPESERKINDMQIEKLIAASTVAAAAAPESIGSDIGETLRSDCTSMRDYLEALLASSRAIHGFVAPGENGPMAELLLFEMQVKKIIDLVESMERDIGQGLN